MKIPRQQTQEEQSESVETEKNTSTESEMADSMFGEAPTEDESFGLSFSLEAQTPPSTQDTMSQQNEIGESNLPIVLPSVFDAAPENTNTQASVDEGGMEIPPGNALKDAIWVEQSNQRAAPGWIGRISRVQDFWKGFHLPIDLFLFGGFVWLLVLLKKNQRLLRQFATGQVDADSHATSQPAPAAETESSPDFNEILERTVSDISVRRVSGE